ncbi:MAG TPA: hypothetical protein DCG19_07310 [Cryomorphaceae bacterium]|nr:hypothetical protein [Owenweeksia sp.]HAD97199.1 hypothetical protein [Cryomorphaceae bacterium]HBF19334.1 hypothetical protein [Cryomorphaceae bacterium]|tara:strand:- start:171 stop:1043 length:873 start_codon:yes stop_codon:yes gene_type:complete
MIWLALSIFCSTLIFVIFKLFDRWKIDNLQAIVINYFIAYSVGTLQQGSITMPWDIIHYKWFTSVVILGFLFITLFQIIAFVSQKIGVSVASVAVKMSLIIPVLFGLYYYNEALNISKVTGILLALLAVYLATRKKEKVKKHPTLAWLPILLFVASGCMDAFLKFNQQEKVPMAENSLFASSVFGMAAVIGILFIIFRLVRGNLHWQWKNVWGGILLGVPNYGSIYFLLRALEFNGLESSVVFPVNNVGIVALSTLAAYFGFREHLSTRNIVGILLSFIAIILIAFGNSA